jgi:FAD/FMN-containing dehydrogenase
VPPGVVGFCYAAFNVSVMAVWQDRTLGAEQIAWARDGATAIEPWSFSGGGHANDRQADEPIERVHATFGTETCDRLQKLRQQYDPRNILHCNQNIHRFGSVLEVLLCEAKDFHGSSSPFASNER